MRTKAAAASDQILREGAQRGPVHAAGDPEHDRHAGRARRQQLGRQRRRSHNGLALCPLARCADHAYSEHYARGFGSPRARRWSNAAMRSSSSTAKAATGQTFRRSTDRVPDDRAERPRTDACDSRRSDRMDALAAYLPKPAAGALPPAEVGGRRPADHDTPYGTLNASNGLPGLHRHGPS